MCGRLGLRRVVVSVIVTISLGLVCVEGRQAKSTLFAQGGVPIPEQGPAAPDNTFDGLAAQPNQPDNALARIVRQFAKRREGELLETTGRFTRSGDRVTFSTEDGSDTFPVLENLALERVLRVIEDSTADQPRLWHVVARITEFRGVNFLLLERVVLKPKAPPEK